MSADDVVLDKCNHCGYDHYYQAVEAEYYHHDNPERTDENLKSQNK